MKIVDYTTVTGDDSRDLVNNVKNAIADGWQPIGGVVVHVFGGPNNEVILVQAMVKYEGA